MLPLPNGDPLPPTILLSPPTNHTRLDLVCQTSLRMQVMRKRYAFVLFSLLLCFSTQSQSFWTGLQTISEPYCSSSHTPLLPLSSLPSLRPANHSLADQICSGRTCPPYPLLFLFFLLFSFYYISSKTNQVNRACRWMT